MMNNELGALVGDGIMQRHGAKLRHNFDEYIRSSWGKALEILKLDNNLIVHPNMVGKAMKKHSNLSTNCLRKYARLNPDGLSWTKR